MRLGATRTIPMGYPMPSRQGVFNPKMRTYRPEQPEDLWQPIYDRMNYPVGGTTQIRFFSIALGGSTTLITAGTAAAKNKTYRDTNWQTSGADLNRAYEAHGVGVIFVPLQQAPAQTSNPATPGIIDDMMRVLYGGWLNIETNNNRKFQLPLCLIPAPAMFKASVATTATNTTLVTGGGVTSSRDFFMFNVPLVLEPGQTIDMTMNWDGTVALTTGNTMDIYLVLASYMRKPS